MDIFYASIHELSRYQVITSSISFLNDFNKRLKRTFFDKLNSPARKLLKQPLLLLFCYKVVAESKYLVSTVLMCHHHGAPFSSKTQQCLLGLHWMLVVF